MKLSDAKVKNPISGGDIRLFDIGGLVSIMGGMALLMILWNIAKNVSSGVASKLPGKVTSPMGSQAPDPNSGLVIH